MQRLRTGLTRSAAAALLAAALVGSAPGQTVAGPEGGYHVVDEWPDADDQSPPGTFITPRGIDMAPDGTLAVVDSGNRRLQRFTPEGQLLRAFGQRGTGPGEFIEPLDVAATADRLYVTDGGRSVIHVLDHEGQAIDLWTGVSEPRGVAVGPRGRVYVVDGAADRIVVLAPTDGSQVDAFGSLSLQDPWGLDVDSQGDVYIADRASRELLVFRDNGRLRDAVALSDLEPRAINAMPNDVHVDTNGNILVTTTRGLMWLYRDRTRRIALEDYRAMVNGERYVTAARARGIYVVRSGVGSVARYGYERGQTRPDLTFGRDGGPQGRLTDASRIQRPTGDHGLLVLTAHAVSEHAPDGAFGRLLAPALNNIEAVAELPDGAVVVATDQLVARYTATGVLEWRWPTPAGGANPGRPGIGEPGGQRWLTGMVYDPAAERIYVMDIGLGELVHLAPDGTELQRIPFTDPERMIVYRDLTRSASGQLVLVNQTARRIEYRTPGWLLRRTLTPRGIPFRVEVADGRTYVLTRDGWAWRYGTDLQLETVWDSGGGRRTVDIAVDAEYVYTLDGGSDQVQVWAYDPALVPQPPPTAPESERCAVEVDKTAAPPIALLGEAVEVTLSIGGTCPDIPPQADIVLVLDRSGSMAPAGKLDAAKDAALSFIEAVDFTQSQVGLVSFNASAELQHGLTQDPRPLRSAVRGLTANGGTDIAAAVDTALDELLGERRRATALGVVVLLTDGNSNARTATLSALEARLDGNRLFTIGLGPDVNELLLTRMASAPEDYYHAPDGDDLAGIYADIARRIRAEVLLRTLTVRDELPDDMTYDGMVAGPDPSVTPGVLSWLLTDISFAGLELRYRLMPTQPGQRKTNVEAAADYVDGLGQGGSATFPVPRVMVLRPTVPTLTPTPTPTPAPRRIYLPVTARRDCRTAAQHADIVLVVDTSSSMNEPTRGGRSKLAAAVDAATTFVGLLELPRDQAGVVAFNRAAQLVAPLSTDRDALTAALAGLAWSPGTRIDLGLATGRQALLAPAHRPANRPVLVLLTDGIPTGTTPDAVRAEARRARQAGATVYVIGLGANVDPALLADVATDPDHLYLTPDGEDLERIYREIAAALPCEG